MTKGFARDWALEAGRDQVAQCCGPVDSYSAISTLYPLLLCFSITTKSMSRYRGQEHCLHPKLQSTKRFIKWYNAWNEKRRYTSS